MYRALWGTIIYSLPIQNKLLEIQSIHIYISYIMISDVYRILFTSKSRPSSNSRVPCPSDIVASEYHFETTISTSNSYTYIHVCTYKHILNIHIYERYKHWTNAKKTYLQLTRLKFLYVHHRTTVVPNGQVAQCSTIVISHRGSFINKM